jgi:hypothetical protein
MHDVLSLATASWSLSRDYEVTALSLHGPYVLAVGLEYADLWRLRPATTPEHVATLVDGVDAPDMEEELVFDLDRLVLFMPLRHQPFVMVYSLGDGTLLDIVVLRGSFWRWPLLYDRGQLLIITSEDEKTCPPYGISRITRCEWRGEEDVTVRHLSLPKDLQHREKRPTVATLAPLLMTSTGDIIGASADWHAQSMDVLRWRGPQSEDYQDPDARLELTMSLHDGDLMGPESMTSIGDETLLLCVHERFAEAILGGGQLLVYAIDIDSLTVRWTADAIWGYDGTIHFVPALGVVIAIARNNLEPDESRYHHPATWIAVLDKDTGARTRMEVINHFDAGAAVVKCTVSQSAEDPALVVVFEDGDHIIMSLRDFVNNGLPKNPDDGSLCVQKAFTESVTVRQAVVGDKTFVLLLVARGNEPLSVPPIHCFTW